MENKSKPEERKILLRIAARLHDEQKRLDELEQRIRT